MGDTRRIVLIERLLLVLLLSAGDTYCKPVTYPTKSNLVKNRATSYLFRTCGAKGRHGPTLEQCQSFYETHSLFSKIRLSDVLSGVQVWQVPKTKSYNIILYGAKGGFGAETKEQNTILEFHSYFKDKAQWPSLMHIRVELFEQEEVYIAIGQAGSHASKKEFFKDSANQSMAAGGGGGGGGGATFVFLKRNGSEVLLAAAGGGGGMGRFDMVAGLDDKAVVRDGKREAGNYTYDTVDIRPGLGGGYNASTKRFKNQDGGRLLPTSPTALLGGRGCQEYNKYYDTEGGFGGGGGGCTAGGAGGGFIGGNASLTDEPNHPGLRGSSFYNSDVVELIFFREFDAVGVFEPDGSVELYEQPPPCPCEDTCRWVDATYKHFDCLRNG